MENPVLKLCAFLRSLNPFNKEFVLSIADFL